ncbi:MBL fold metallo-hydrolase [Shewanella schlegeliana]|uniref:MBL fold metallo-hydrolase n=1 Tax=Shewanella schlegeliana TaxID=190308 RepID=A0ABS1SXU5_9GAMM|nr:alkyl sulfatase dimerization domain-containing protein [Shewanella schlegeliana]MBL4913363.1 MBL fold metallo-hydrolase [Shewanella schlegeliana]MCL1109318.1 MBL fold metallo-hydrolase [Shewanella schlegeliana]GIU38056.1 MBL fold metallo-hydrolase [Shewanella schlegeliana]
MKQRYRFIVYSLLLSSASIYAEEHDLSIKDVGGKPATPQTQAANRAYAETLNFTDVRAFENNDKGLVAEFDQKTGDIIRNSFKFIDENSADSAPATVNPSLWRQAVLNQKAEGLYEVLPGKIYQIRGADLASLSFIRGKTGWIVYDVLTTKEAAAQSLKFFQENVPQDGDLPVVAMLYSHSHADHFGGARAIQEAFPDVKVYGSKNITKETVDENVLAGNAMSRRAAYQYGATLGRNEHGIVDAALAKGLSSGQITYVTPDYELNLKADVEELTIDGLEMVFLDASGTEAPSEMVTYIPSMKALWTGEVTYQGMHNIYTLRGAKVRDALKWSKKINQMLNMWGGEVEVLFASHSAPIWSTKEIVDYLKMQRDAYGFTHNQTLRLANNGYVLQDLGDKIYEVMPESIQKAWHTNGYHGTYSHNARAVYNMYLGYFDMNPANLNPLPIKAESAKFVEYMGGAKAILNKAKKDFSDGDYRFVATVLNKVVQAEPNNTEARAMLADAYEQMGYQAEGAGWRNIYLTGAQELRLGKVSPGAPKTASADILSEMDPGMLLDYIAVQVDSLKAQHTPFTMNIIVDGEVYFVEMSNGNLSNIKVEQAKKDADATITLDDDGFTKILLGQARLSDLIASKDATLEGDDTVLSKLVSTLVKFDEKFEIVPFSDKTVDSNLYQ